MKNSILRRFRTQHRQLENRRAAARGESPATPGDWVRDLAFGVRFAVSGGREGWTRTLLTAVGVGLGVALLLVAAAVPAILNARGDRGADRGDSPSSYSVAVRPTAETIVTGRADTTYRGQDVYGRLVQPDGDRPLLPPGLDELPAPGEMFVSPELGKLLASPEGALLKERLGHKVSGTIGEAGLLGPRELAYYAGADNLVPDGENPTRTDDIGGPNLSEALGPFLTLLVIITFVVLLMPVAVLIATAVRFGGERRDRRLAALRLVGADAHMTRRIAAGEALFGALIGLAVGLGLFVGGRQLIGTVELWRISVFASDVSPSPLLAALIVAGVPVTAVAVTLFALRTVSIEPLGVARNTGTARRRLWWRLMLPAVGVALLSPMIGGLSPDSQVNELKIAVGAVLLLVGVTALLPWAMETVVGRMRGGPLPLQLATRRLQLDSGASARTVNGITVAVAGAIAVQMLFSGLESRYTQDTGFSPLRGEMRISRDYTGAAQQEKDTAALRATPGVASTLTYTLGHAHEPGTPPDPGAFVIVGDCAALGQIVEASDCRPGSVYLAGDLANQDPLTGGQYLPAPGARVDLSTQDKTSGKPGAPKLWTVPSAARLTALVPDPAGSFRTGIFATPEAINAGDLGDAGTELLAKLDPADRDAAEQVRNTAARMDPLQSVQYYEETATAPQLTNIKRGLFIGTTVTLLLIGASMLVTMLEQLRERRKLLSVLVAFGTRRSTLGMSVLWQTTLPVTLGLALAVVGGLGLGVILLKMAVLPLAVDWAGIAWMTGISGGVVLLVTLLSLPPLWRMMRPDGLRTE
ncbi:FtsX-like permease family protein [Streptomyces sp. G1]|uniref:FtsX-like permease family protein n=1 Tax=Streptomyces sp. G1 TaxID=361572 RepID=UPI0020309DC9|nr:FtsX-like permease family protein [Streptomyces sp. G1]MCM1976452.1 ABC transporter permease [Streptomyces sp. G1]